MAELICPSCGAAATGDAPLCAICIRPFVPRQTVPRETVPREAVAREAVAPEGPVPATRVHGADWADPARAADSGDPADPADVGDVAAGGPDPTAAVAAPVRARRPVPGCADEDCEHDGVVPAGGCRACGRAGDLRAREPVAGPSRTVTTLAFACLSFPWGDETVPSSGRLLIGREASPLAPRLAAYTNVSRRHAEISLVGGRLCVIDLESVNGTFVNGERVAPMTPSPLRDGDEVRFAAGLRAVVVQARNA